MTWARRRFPISISCCFSLLRRAMQEAARFSLDRRRGGSRRKPAPDRPLCRGEETDGSKWVVTISPIMSLTDSTLPAGTRSSTEKSSAPQTGVTASSSRLARSSTRKLLLTHYLLCDIGRSRLAVLRAELLLCPSRGVATFLPAQTT